MRTSIRDPNNHELKRVVVPDRGLAEYLHSLFPGSSMERLDIGLGEIDAAARGRPRKYSSNRDRVANQRQKAREEKIRILNELFFLQNSQDASGMCWEKEKEWEYRAENGIASYTHLSTQLPSRQDTEILVADFAPHECCGSLLAHKTSPTPFCYLRWVDEETFVSWLQALHGGKLKTKEENYLISPSVFDPNKCGGGKRRGTDNIVYVRHLWLDFEDGDLSPDEFPKLFPHYRMLVTNSFHHTANKPRFRVMMPTTQPIPRDAYPLLYDNIAAKLEETGYTILRSSAKKKISRSNGDKPKSGLDWSKRPPTSLFYLPCQAEDPTQSFFRYYDEPGREALDPVPWIENTVAPLQPEFPSWSAEPNGGPKEINQALVDSAIQDWRATRAVPKHGNQNFFLLGRKLKSAGMDTAQIATTLATEASFARSPKERKEQIRSIIETLTKGRIRT
jgi:hypothetical protein